MTIAAEPPKVGRPRGTRKQFCKRGHDLSDPQNQKPIAGGYIRCRQCQLDACKAWRDERKKEKGRLV